MKKKSRKNFFNLLFTNRENGVIIKKTLVVRSRTIDVGKI